MEVYHGPHLIIEYEKENSRLINTWKSNPSNEVVYREELLEYLEISKKIKLYLYPTFSHISHNFL